jgi:hypothetical protein
VLSVRGLLDLIRTALGEADDEDTQIVAVGSLDGGVSLNQSLNSAI